MQSDYSSAVIIGHAAYQMARRRIDVAAVQRILESPEQVLDVRSGRVMLPSRLMRKGKAQLMQLFVDTDRDPVEVVTAYLTSTVEKYWSVGAR